MKLSEIIIISLLVITQLEVLSYICYKYYIEFKKHSKVKKDDILKSLVTKQKEDELIVEKDKDITMIDEYIKYIKSVIDNYNNSRSKRISLKTRQTLLLNTINILPIASRHIQLSYYYNLDDKEWYKLTDRDMMMLLESAYNDYTHDNLDSLNSVFTASLRLRDDRR